MKIKIGELESSYHENLKELRHLQEENRDMKLDIEDLDEEVKSW